MSARPEMTSAAASVREALALLTRASADWRNGGQSPEGSLHWPVAVNLARRELRQALETIEAGTAATATPATDSDGCACGREQELRALLAEASERLRGWSAGAGPDGKLIGRIAAALKRNADDAGAGMRWYNGLTPTQRWQWHEIAGSAVPADAYRAYCEDVYAPGAGGSRP